MTEQSNKHFVVEISEEEVWAVVTALREYSNNPINEEHGKLSLSVYQRIKALVLEESEKRLLESQ